jgi:hypothetical protein
MPSDDPLLKFDLRDLHQDGDHLEFLHTLRRLYLSHPTVRQAVNEAVLITERLTETRIKWVEMYRFGIRYTTPNGTSLDLPYRTFEVHRAYTANVMIFTVSLKPENLIRLGNTKIWWLKKHVPHFAEGLKNGALAHVLDANRVTPLSGPKP